MEAWEPTLFNLGHAYRKVRKYDEALRYFRSALRLSPRNVSARRDYEPWGGDLMCGVRQASIHSALGFTHHMKGNLEEAIECYHAVRTLGSHDWGGFMSGC
jgi:anaphase-promoting complex subunit 6